MTAERLNYCTTCRRDFASLKAFDRHRVGDFPQTGPGEYLTRARAGLVDLLDDWQPAHGRRCLEDDELLAAGLRSVRAAGGDSGWPKKNRNGSPG